MQRWRTGMGDISISNHLKNDTTNQCQQRKTSSRFRPSHKKLIQNLDMYHMEPALHRETAFCRSPLNRLPKLKRCNANCLTARPICHLRSRRQILKAIVLLPMIPTNAQAVLEYPALRGLDENPQGAPFFTQDGIKIQPIAIGTGDDTVQPGSLVSVKYVLRRSNGYFIDASYGFDRFETFSFRAGSGQVIQGFDRAISGMRIGARLRFIVPPELGYVAGLKGAGPIPPDFGARRSLASHAKEPLVFEVQVVKIRN